jgi:hypothetical protein
MCKTFEYIENKMLAGRSGVMFRALTLNGVQSCPAPASTPRSSGPACSASGPPQSTYSRWSASSQEHPALGMLMWQNRRMPLGAKREFNGMKNQGI